MPLSRRSLFALHFTGPHKPASTWLRVHRTAMACRFEIRLPAAAGAHMGAGRKALEEADRVEAMLSPWRENGEAARVNRQAGGAAVAASPDFFALLQYCAQLYADSAGAFDVTAHVLGLCRATARREGRPPTPAALASARGLVGFDGVHLDPAQGTVRIARRGAAISFGGLAKGYAVDRMGQALRAQGVTQALISSGGSSVLAIGGRDKGWVVSVQSDPQERPLRIRLTEGALGTSGGAGQFVLLDGRRDGRVLDPRTGVEPREVRRATVVAADATTADALSTAFLAGGTHVARRYCDAHAGVLAVLTLNDAAATRRTFGAYHGGDIAGRRDA
jgi:thiamine biosynthesis lipoprotein